MKFHLRNLWGELDKDGKVLYWLSDTDGKRVDFNEFVGKKIKISFSGEKRCLICHKKTEKLYPKGVCETCFHTAPRCDICMMKPELCHFKKGTCRDEEFAKNWCFKNQYIYFSITNDLKVGYMSKENEPQRWIDQGAKKAIIFASLPERKVAGDLERRIAEFEKDKTNWSKMLKGECVDHDLASVKRKWANRLRENWGEYITADEKIWELEYPVIKYPQKIKRFSLESEPEITGILYGIRGQYLMFKDRVLNIVKHEGYELDIIVSEAEEKDLLEQRSLF